MRRDELSTPFEKTKDVLDTTQELGSEETSQAHLVVL
jgi:hypothetical protein